MGITERRQRQKEEVRSSILETAWKMVLSEGWQSLSIRKIADAIEYSVTVIYDHFENKEAILLEFAQQGFNLLVKKLRQAAAKSTDPARQLMAIADAYWNFAFSNKEYYQLMFGLGIASCDSSQCIMEKTEFRDVIMKPIVALLGNEKHKSNVNACLKYHTYWSVMHGLISIKLMNNSVSDELDKRVLDDAIAGFIKNLQQ